MPAVPPAETVRRNQERELLARALTALLLAGPLRAGLRLDVERNTRRRWGRKPLDGIEHHGIEHR